MHYRLGQLQYSASNHVASFESEADLVTQFLHSPTLFTDAIAVENALIKYEVQDEPNSALVAMTLAYKNKSTTAHMYHQHMAQAAALWSQLSTQMIEMLDAEVLDNADKETLGTKRCYWQQQLLDESLFSRMSWSELYIGILNKHMVCKKKVMSSISTLMKAWDGIMY
ncbi:hypothetical protein [Psychrobacter sp. JCM 18903]|uniref:hypothetical protein n=1 Tax=Psychrobacter sp. JCM 18903 TaxID=1298610 RepID=UPI0005EE19AF|nr:hypothetical protein [Psychrobacter sp. JCM 18903]